MKKSILILILYFISIVTLFSQDIEPSKNKIGMTLSTNLFGFNDDLNRVDVGGAFYFSRKTANRFSIYTEILCV